MGLVKTIRNKVTGKPARNSHTKTAEPPRPSAVSIAALSKLEVKKIQGLLKSKTSGGVALGLSLLESLGATRADREAVFTDRVVSSIVREPQISTGTVERWEHLLDSIRGFRGLIGRFTQQATKSVKQRKGFLDLATLPRLSSESAKALATREDGGRAVYALHLGGLKSLDPEVAKALAGFRGSLWLDGLTSLSPETARGLAAHKGCSISLDGLRSLSDEAGRALASHRGDSLSLDGLKVLTPAVARALAQYKGNQLGLNGVRTLCDEAATALLMRHAGWLALNGLTSLSPTASRVFAQSKRFLQLGGVTRLTPEAARALAKHKGIIELGIIEIDAEVAAALAQFKGRDLELRELATVPPQALASLQANRNITLLDKFRPEEPAPKTISAANRGSNHGRG